MSDTRDRIVAAARDLFHAQGYHGTSLAQIGEAAAARPGSLYYFFKSKEALLVAVLDSYRGLLYPEVLEPAWATTDDPIERIFAVLAGYRRMLAETGCAAGCPIGNLALELVDPAPAVREGLAVNFEGWCRGIERCLDAAADRLPADLDRRRLARFVLTVMEGGVVQARGARSIAPFDDAVEQLRDYFARLVRNSPAERGGDPR